MLGVLYMKRILALVLTCVMLFACVSVSAYAAEMNTVTTRANPETGVMYGGTGKPINMGVLGSNPKFTFSISGNTSLYVDVYVVKGPGTSTGQYVMRNILCDGSQHTVRFSNAYSGEYQLKIVVNHGSTWGEAKNYTMSVSY